ncbi:hypothetical protein K458DRAFT_417396 [Lentithecium fluviatile CBS 122367]|uniref:BZIP domain-containing protein n=1 Tax=Lentithecium fluviatile CBS 122367 TaxID=1168545 RepID=A0A6G1J492_9PLEO|nr:hypothetical protein K458DRAFT_417396 [Lentithecium fluviatile CBS 122367]
MMSHDDLPPLSSTNGRSHGNTLSSETPSPTTTTETPVNPPARRLSGTRNIVPTPLTTHSLTPRVSIATASSSPSDTTAHPSPVGGGPTSTSYVVPPRPKPGRKPATDEPASKRKAQNRESQRAFRARKAAKLNEMQAHVETTESKHRDEMNQKIAELLDKDRRIKELEGMATQRLETDSRTAQERDFWKERCGQLEAQVQDLSRQLRDQNYPLNMFGEKQAVFFQAQLPGSRQDSPTRGSVASFTGYNTPTAMDIGCGNCKPDGECACIAELAKVPSINPFMAAVPLIRAPTRTSVSPLKGIQVQAIDFTDREIDFTAQFSSKRARPVQRPSIAFMTEASEVDSKCGFCTDDLNCLCRDESLRYQDIQRAPDEVITSSSPATKRSARGAVVSGPGSCADCQANPQQKAWCQRVAQLRTSSNDFLPSPTSRTSSIGSALGTMEPKLTDPYGNKSSIGCSEAFKLLEGRVPMDQDKMDWIGNLKPVSQDRRDTLTQPSRKYSALELDTAGVIATLGSTMQPIQARPSDGENAALVRMAQNYQRTTQSPQADSGSPLPISSLVNGINAPASWQ